MEKHFKGKNCIVTGGAGFIGQNIVKKLIEYGAHVTIIDNFTYGSSKKTVHKKAYLIKGDIRSSSIFKKLPKKRYDYLFHFAAPSSNVLFLENLPECIDITVRGFLNTIRYAAENKIRYVYPSTGSLYNGVNPPHTENAILDPKFQNEYAKTKIAIEYLAGIYRPAVNAIGLRILAGYGPGELHKGRFQGVVYGFCRSMYQGRAPVIWGNGNQRRDFVFIDDIVHVALTLAATCPEPIVNVGTGRDISFKEVIALVNRNLKTPIEPIYAPKPAVYLEQTTADTSLLRKYYKRKFTPIEKGIKAVFASFETER